MPNGLFPRFIAAVRNGWISELPNVQPVDRTLSPLMPKASTFHVRLGAAPPGVAPHVFLRFLHNPKAWNAGSLAINLIVSKQYGPPTRGEPRKGQFERGHEGLFRLPLVHGTGQRGKQDKWWRLAPPMFPVRAHERGWWLPSSFADESVVFAEAIDDVTKDVRAALTLVAARRL